MIMLRLLIHFSTKLLVSRVLIGSFEFIWGSFEKQVSHEPMKDQELRKNLPDCTGLHNIFVNLSFSTTRDFLTNFKLARSTVST